MKIRNILLGAIFLASGAANASTVFVPTDGDINFIAETFNIGTQLAMFDDSDTLFGGNKLFITPIPENINVSAGGAGAGDWTATNESFATLNLTGSNRFRLAISTDSGVSWSGDTSTSPAGTNVLNVTFSDGTILTVDIAVAGPPAAVPVPPAVWLFGSGLLGLVGIARRKKAA